MAAATAPVNARPKSEATTVEIGRAVAEVQAAIQLAIDRPRDVDAAVERMRQTCARPAVAENAFYSFDRGGSRVVGPTVDLMVELARCWGHMLYGVNELNREFDRTELLAYAWDLETNTRSAFTFIVSHVNYSSRDRKALAAERDIADNNASVAGRRLRGQLEKVLPRWFLQEAEQLCRETLAGDKSVEERIESAVSSFAALGVSQKHLEERVKKPLAEWGDAELATLMIVRKSIVRAESSVEAEFPSSRVTAAEITGAPEPEPAAKTKDVEQAVAEAEAQAPAVTAEDLRAVGSVSSIVKAATRIAGRDVINVPEVVADQDLAQRVLADLRG